MNNFKQIRTEWLATLGRNAIAKKYGLSSNQNTCTEEAYNEEIRQSIEDSYQSDRICNAYGYNVP